MQSIFSLLPILSIDRREIKINYNGILQAIIIAVVIGIYTNHIIVARLEVRMIQIEKQVNQIYNDIYYKNINKKIGG